MKRKGDNKIYTLNDRKKVKSSQVNMNDKLAVKQSKKKINIIGHQSNRNVISSADRQKVKKAHNDKITTDISNIPSTKLGIPKSKTKLSVFEKLKMKLDGSKFRMLNEKLYNIKGNEALTMFSESPKLFDIYHEGFRQQVESWPENPLDIIISEIKKHPKAVVGDFGCGDAKLSRCINNKVYSFDLAANNNRVIVCDMSHVPIKDNTLDISVYCLSLMGTNLNDYLSEAYRVTKLNGMLIIAEVKSRLKSDEWFKDCLVKLGWNFKFMNDHNKMFTIFIFSKSNRKPGHIQLSLKACEYKRR